MDQLNAVTEALQLNDKSCSLKSSKTESNPVDSADVASAMEWYRHPEFGHPHDLKPAPGFCSECKALSIEYLVSLTESLGNGGYSFTRTYGEQRRSASFCGLCRAICLAVLMTARDDARDTGRAAEDFVAADARLALVARDTSISSQDTIVITDAEVDSDDGYSTDRSVGAYVGPRCRGILKGDDLVGPRNNDRHSDIYNPPSRYGSRVSSRESNFARTLATWLDQCDSEHPACDNFRSTHVTGNCSAKYSKLPNRLVGLNESQGRLELFLQETEGQYGMYCALSHCWGGQDVLKTTGETIEAFKVGISFDLLPRTFIDAVKIAYHAGLSYIWIDSLCILQDDIGDWDYNSSQMDKIYSGAYFTISASAAASSAGGCLPVQVSPSQFVRIPLAKNDSTKHRGDFATLIPANGQSLCWDFYYEPLQKRGWTLQERLLSQRVLYCSRYTYIWLCRESHVTESLNDAESFFDYNKQDDDDDDGNRVLLLPAQYSTRQKALNSWYGVLEDYSNRKLTHSTDKLPAIAGLAKRFQESIEGPYSHGHWGSDLEESLLWRHDNHWYNQLDETLQFRLVKPFDLGRSRSRRSVPQRAPSWSWASVDGFISYGGPRLLFKRAKGNEEAVVRKVTRFYPLWHVSFASDAEHDKYAISTRFSRPCLLRVVGRLFEAVPRLESDSEGESSSVEGGTRGKARKTVWEIVDAPEENLMHYMDDPSFSVGDVEPDQRFYMLPVTLVQWLILTNTSQPNVYRRIGLIERHTHLYDDSESESGVDDNNHENSDQDERSNGNSSKSTDFNGGEHEVDRRDENSVIEMVLDLGDKSDYSVEAPADGAQLPIPPWSYPVGSGNYSNSSRSRRSSESISEKRTNTRMIKSWRKVEHLGSIQTFYIS